MPNNKLKPDNIEIHNKTVADFGHLDYIHKFFENLSSAQDNAISPNLMFDTFLDFNKNAADSYQGILANPEKAYTSATNAFNSYMDLINYTVNKSTNPSNDLEPVVKPAKGDKRFRHESWDNQPYFDYLKQSYLIFSQFINTSIDQLDGITPDQKRKIKFYAKTITDTMSPSNFPMTNPEVLTKAVETNGESLIEGMQNFLRDTNSSTGELSIKNCNMNAFQVGKNIAYTPGKVVYQNDLMQLIQYEPSTPSVYKTPMLIIPAWINKYYIFDLQSHNSFIKWAVDNGHTVYIISWINPGIEHRNKCFEDYIKFGPMAAMEFIKKSIGEPKVNAIGYCLGGIILTSLMGMLGKDAKKHFNTASLFATLIDFSKAGDLLLFSHGNQASNFQSQIDKLGYLDSKTMSLAFNSLKANEMIWSAFVNNYLLGNEAPSFDILYWNADATNLPAKMYDFYIQAFFKNNKLIKPHALTLMNKEVNIKAIDVPSFVLGTIEDHIAPWQSSYPAMQLFSGDRKFVLGGSGHVAGVINPADSNKYGFWSNSDINTDPSAWLENATHHSGSWWNEWHDWIKNYTDKMVNADERKVIDLPFEDAPGSYIRMK